MDYLNVRQGLSTPMHEHKPNDENNETLQNYESPENVEFSISELKVAARKSREP